LETKDPLDHEAAKNEYTVTVGVTDNKNDAGGADDTVDATIDVTITVTNVVETGETNSQPEFATPMSQKIPVVVDNKPVAQ
jgi:hypothetical protein